MVPPEPPIPIRPEFRQFITACEHMLAAIASSPGSAMSTDERRLIAFYRDELAKLTSGRT